MKRDLKTLFLNITAGIISYYVVKFLDTNDLPLLSYFVFGLYLVFVCAGSYFHFKHSKKSPIPENNGKDKSDPKINNNEKDIIHNILKTVVKLSSQKVDATAKVIGTIINEDPNIVLAYLKKMSDDFLVVFANEGKPPNINVPFFVAYHENPWKLLKMIKREQIT